MPTITYAGHTVPVVPINEVTLGEADALERAVGMTMKRIAHLEKTCVCEHGKVSHTARTDDGGNVLGPCQACACDGFDPDLPTRVATAGLWLSVRRAIPTLTFATFAETPTEDFVINRDEVAGEAPDPS